jgi:hypothetical protein
LVSVNRQREYQNVNPEEAFSYYACTSTTPDDGVAKLLSLCMIYFDRDRLLDLLNLTRIHSDDYTAWQSRLSDVESLAQTLAWSCFFPKVPATERDLRNFWRSKLPWLLSSHVLEGVIDNLFRYRQLERPGNLQSEMGEIERLNGCWKAYTGERLIEVKELENGSYRLILNC